MPALTSEERTFSERSLLPRDLPGSVTDQHSAIPKRQATGKRQGLANLRKSRRIDRLRLHSGGEGNHPLPAPFVKHTFQTMTGLSRAEVSMQLLLDTQAQGFKLYQGTLTFVIAGPRIGKPDLWLRLRNSRSPRAASTRLCSLPFSLSRAAIFRLSLGN